MARALDSISLLINVASSRDVPFHPTTAVTVLYKTVQLQDTFGRVDA